MSLLRRSRAELAGAWRSLRYDMGRRPVEPTPGGPDMTSTGMSTFGGAELTGDTGTGAHGPSRPPRTVGVAVPRWMVAVTALGALTATGAAAAYVGVVHGMGSLLPAGPAVAEALPAPAVATTEARRGQGSAPRTPRGPATTTGAAAPGQTTPTLPLPATTHPRTTAQVLPATSMSPDLRLDSPPVPTPTAPDSVPSPTPPPSPSASPSRSAGSSGPTHRPSPGPSRPSAGWPGRWPGSWPGSWPVDWPGGTAAPPTGPSATPGEKGRPSGRSHFRWRLRLDH